MQSWPSSDVHSSTGAWERPFWKPPYIIHTHRWPSRVITVVSILCEQFLRVYAAHWRYMCNSSCFCIQHKSSTVYFLQLPWTIALDLFWTGFFHQNMGFLKLYQRNCMGETTGELTDQSQGDLCIVWAWFGAGHPRLAQRPDCFFMQELNLIPISHHCHTTALITISHFNSWSSGRVIFTSRYFPDSYAEALACSIFQNVFIFATFKVPSQLLCATLLAPKQTR